MKDLEDKFSEVKEYIYNNPRASIDKIAKENDVTVNTIRKWVREERLEFSADSPVGLQCEKCGKIIKTGRFCKECKTKMSLELDSYQEKPQVVEVKKETRDRGKMRFL